MLGGGLGVDEHPSLLLHHKFVECMQELEEARRLYSSQKRALKDAMSAAAEREAAEVAAGESGLEAATAAAEEEVERLAQVRDRLANKLHVLLQHQ